MIVPFSTFHSRVLRRGTPYYMCRVTNVEMAHEVIKAAAKAKDPLIVSLLLEKAYPYPLEVLIQSVHSLADQSDSLCMIQLEIGKVRLDEQALAALQIQIVLVESQSSLLRHPKGVRAHLPSGVAIAVSVSSSQGFTESASLVHTLGADAVLLIKEKEISQEISLKYTAEAVRNMKVPVTIQADNLTAKQIKMLRKTGIGGYYLKEALPEAYTAGMRTGLRDRNRRDPAIYTPYATLAVRKTYEHYSSLIHT